MIKKTQYVQLTLLLMFIFVLFLLTAMSISFQGEVPVVDSDVSEELRSASGAAVDTIQNPAYEQYLVIIEGDNAVGARNIEKQLTYLKKKYKCYKTLEDVPLPILDHMQQLILCSSTIEGYYSYSDIVMVSKQGTDIIFAVLPTAEHLTQEWLDLLGIRYIGERYTQKGIVSLDQFLSGGTTWYEDYRLRTQRIKTNSSCKTFLAGINDKTSQEQLRNEDATDIVWRTVFYDSRIFVVNGNFFSNMDHIGILGSLFARMEEDYLYPVVNAKMLFIEDAPYLSDENGELMEERYARTAGRFLQEIAIPGIVSLSMALEIQPQFYGTQYFESPQGSVNSEIVSFLKDELIKIGGDIQLSANENRVSKLVRSMDIFENVTGNKVTSLLFGEYDKKLEREVMNVLSYKGEISSIVHKWSDYPELMMEDGYVYIPMMTEGYYMDSDTMLMFDGAAVSLGLITHGISMKEMIFPETEDDDWATAFKDFSAYYYTACEKYSWMDGVNAEGLEQRVRQYLAMTSEITYKQKKILLNVKNLYAQGYFILQTEKEIKKMSSGEFEKIEDGMYLLTITDEETEIVFKQKQNA